jgi:undecaprenol kinase
MPDNRSDEGYQKTRRSKGAGSDMRCAFLGLIATFREERNFRIETVAAVLVIAAGIILRISAVEFAIVIGVIALVMCLEVINSAVERTMNAMSAQHDPLIGRIKDMAAGAVFLAVVASVAVGLFIFLPHLSEFISRF